MRDPTDDSAAVPRRSTTTRVALVGAVAVLLSVLPIAPTVVGPVGAITVGLVLAEAIALYVVYGALSRFVNPVLRETLERE